MEWALKEYSYRECCGQRIRDCDDCDCYQCERCETLNYTENHPDNDYVCFECYLIEKEYRDDEIDS